MKNKLISRFIYSTIAILVPILPFATFAASGSDLSVEPPNVDISTVLTNIRNYF